MEKFFTNILERTEVISFETRQYIVEGEMVVVLGNRTSADEKIRTGNEAAMGPDIHNPKWINNPNGRICFIRIGAGRVILIGG